MDRWGLLAAALCRLDHRAIAWQTDACAVVEKMAITNEMFRDVSRQDNLFVSKMLSGGGTLRAEGAVEIQDD